VSIEIFWTLPTNGDGPAPGRSRFARGDFAGGRRANLAHSGLTDPRNGPRSDPRSGLHTYYDYLLQVARAAEVSGFGGVVIPWEPSGEDPWIVAASLARHTRRLTLVPELEVAFATPVYLAKMSASFQRLAQGRLGWKLDLERDASVRRAHGDALQGAAQLERASEYLEVAKGVWNTRPYDFHGSHYDVEAGGFESPLSGQTLPRVFTSGGSEPALELAARHADVHVLAAGSDASLQARAKRLSSLARERGRRVSLGLHLRVLARHSEQEARRDAVEGAFDLSGSYDAVAARLARYAELGIQLLVLEAPPHLEEAYRLGEHVLPRLHAQRQPAAAAAAVTSVASV